MKGLEREPDEATAEALKHMSIKLLEAEAELAQKEVSCLLLLSLLTYLFLTNEPRLLALH